MAQQTIIVPENNIDFFIGDINRIIFRLPTSTWKIDGIQYTENYSLVYSLDGDSLYNIEGIEKPLRTQKNSLYIFPPMNKRSAKANPDHPWSFIYINFNLHFSNPEAQDKFNNILFHTADCSGEIKNSLQKAVHIWEEKNDYYKLRCRTLINDVLYHLLINHNYIYASPHIKSMIRVNKYIHANFTEKLSVDDLAQIAGLSVSYFRKLFTQTYGLSPVKYILKLRLDKASELLKDGHFNVAETASLCGFNDVFYFSKFYKQKNGIPPSEEMKQQ